MTRKYIHRPEWNAKPIKPSHQEQDKAEGNSVMTAHPLAIVDKVNRKLLEKGIMPRIISAAILAIALCGCVTDSMDPYEAKQGNAGLGKLCTKWVTWEGKSVETDSTATCKDGTAPRLYFTQWLTHTDNCTPSQEQDVVGGIKGVRRVFGCRK